MFNMESQSQSSARDGSPITANRRRGICSRTAIALLALCAVLGATPPARSAGRHGAEIWRFDRTSSIGGHATKVLGHPQIIDSPYGKAVQFNGVDDALFVDEHPLAGAAAWTWEVIFRPDADGKPAQRFFHLSVLDPATGKDKEDRMLFEIRIVQGQWCLDSFAQTGGHSKALLNCQDLHPLGRWYRVTAVYDGKTLKNYVGDEMQGEGEVQLAPQGPGHSSVGVRINLKDYFKGAVYEARFTRRALRPDEFLKMPKAAGPQ
ncbi:MAG TPA: LamG-like jellyroll fold domain-containing protein [Acidobacteriaceae bacterium]|nr:LamG-like jellyroll fold domain-containing protein [Acidobacteriaceae bacterium]